MLTPPPKVITAHGCVVNAEAIESRRTAALPTKTVKCYQGFKVILLKWEKF